MLQQILDQMYIDPELMAELSEDQKQMLFYKMRQEQIRRWKVFEEKAEEERAQKSRNTAKKKVEFMKGRDGCDWVWVMGEHKNDKSIEQILEEEAHTMAGKLADAEAQALREKEEADLKKKMEEERQRLLQEHLEREQEMRRKQEEAALYQSIKEAKLAAEKLALEKKRQEEEERKRLEELEQSTKFQQEVAEDKVCHSSVLNSPFLSDNERKAKRKSRELAESIREKRSSEIYTSLRKQRETMEKMAEENQKEVETNWQEQEKKSKEADLERREKARLAREEYRESLRRSMTLVQASQAFSSTQTSAGNKPPLPPKKHLIATSAPGITSKKPRPLRPKNREQVISWFQKDEKPKGSGLDPSTGKVAEWFHGIINRSDAEEMLENKKPGSFLIRVSERVWGYTLSLRESNRFKHFLIDASDMGYQFFGADQTVHETLAGLVLYHKNNPITLSGQELLLNPCGQTVNPPDYHQLFEPPSRESTTL
ncbi:unnamed protein product [Lymnaea stagnalis]|uniref:SH2 domain-containing protein n=1 Tax=Lymnaea stagnalis TaxID=6523 RepID=A0AAV2I3J4_LYMST